RHYSSPILRIDGHIVVGEVRGPDGFMGAAPAEVDADGDLLFVHHRLAGGLGVAGGAAALVGDQHVAEVNGDSGHVEIGKARPADGGEDAAPVGVGGEQGGLHQGGFRHGVGHRQAFGAGGTAGDIDGDELGGPLPV